MPDAARLVIAIEDAGQGAAPTGAAAAPAGGPAGSSGSVASNPLTSPPQTPPVGPAGTIAPITGPAGSTPAGSTAAPTAAHVPFTPFPSPPGGPPTLGPAGHIPFTPFPGPAPPPVPTGPAGGPVPGLGLVSAFDRPVPVIIVGPHPLPVSMEKAKTPPASRAAHHEELEPRNRARRFLEQAGYVAQRVGQVGAGLAKNDLMPAFSGAIDAAAGGLRMLGPVGMAAAAGLQAGAFAVKAFIQTVNAFVERGRELARFDARLAMASGLADVKRLQADIREAQKLGDGMSRLIEAQADAEVAIRELVLPIKQFIVESLADIMELVARACRFFLGEGEKPKPGELNAIMQDFFDSVDMLPRPGGGKQRFNDNADRANGQRLGMPILGL